MLSRLPHLSGGLCPLLACVLTTLSLSIAPAAEPFALDVRKRTETGEGSGRFHAVAKPETWNPAKTAILVCDVWDLHTSRNATLRTGELAPAIDALVKEVRKRGGTVIHCPSDTMAHYEGHPARIAAQVVSEIGFLGAGAILRSPLGVVGMTTAATIWVAAAIGMVVGAGHVGAGLGLSTLVLILLNGVSRIEAIYQGACEYTTATVLYEPAGGKTLIRILDLLDEYRLKGRRSTTEVQTPGLERVELHYCKVHMTHREVLNRLAGMREVREIHTNLGV